MKKLYLVLVAFMAASFSFAQCVIDTTFLSSVQAGMYPTAVHLPHAVRDSLFNQTVQGKITDSINMNFLGFVSVSARVDSVRLDSINGLPNGITWVKNPDVLRGGGYGCVEFTGTATDTPGTYNLQAIGMVWAHLEVPLLGVNVDTFSYGSLNRFPPFNNYFIVVDSVQQPLSVTLDANSLCFGAGNEGSIIATAEGGSPVAPYSYLWSTDNTGYRVDSLSAGSYSITVTSGSETASASATIDTQPSPVTTTVTATGSTGNDGTASVTATGGVPPYTYFWTGGAGNTDSVTDLAPGTYRVTVRDSFGCATVDTAIVEDLSTGINPLADEVSQLSLFPNPANNIINLVIESKKNFSSRMEVMDLTGRIIYGESLTVSGRFSKAINLGPFNSGIYILRLTSVGQSMHQRFVVSH